MSQDQGDDQRRFAPDPVAVMPEDRRPHRPRYEADRVNGEGFERSGQRIRSREEQRGENEPGHHAVEKEVVPLDRRADGAGDDGAPKLHGVVGVR
jgi:hypothetical protein